MYFCISPCYNLAAAISFIFLCVGEQSDGRASLPNFQWPGPCIVWEKMFSVHLLSLFCVHCKAFSDQRVPPQLKVPAWCKETSCFLTKGNVWIQGHRPLEFGRIAPNTFVRMGKILFLLTCPFPSVTGKAPLPLEAPSWPEGLEEKEHNPLCLLNLLRHC